ncbi:hypothetical protein MJN47_28840, partial [Salmonella enterica subsp. enterica serovar Lubbock]|nr:hypothetical protein [Salmonella enterica subsp. enterica serovar Lubbock]
EAAKAAADAKKKAEAEAAKAAADAKKKAEAEAVKAAADAKKKTALLLSLLAFLIGNRFGSSASQATVLSTDK